MTQNSRKPSSIPQLDVDDAYLDEAARKWAPILDASEQDVRRFLEEHRDEVNRLNRLIYLAVLDSVLDGRSPKH